MNKRLDRLKDSIIKQYAQCFLSYENLKFFGPYFIEKFKNPQCSFDHKKLSDEIHEAIFNKNASASYRCNAVLLLRQCMQTGNRFLINYVEQNIIEKYGKIAILTKKPNFEATYFGDKLEQPWGSLYFQEIMGCLMSWQRKSLYYETIVKNLLKGNVDLKAQLVSKNVKPNHALVGKRMTIKERIKIKVKFFNDVLYFMYSCFALHKMEDDLSYVLELLKDLAASIELEKEPLRQIEDSKDLIEQLNQLDNLLYRMTSDYTKGETISIYTEKYKKVLVEFLDVEEDEEDAKIISAYDKEFCGINTENCILSFTSLSNLDFDQIPKRTCPNKSCIFSDTKGNSPQTSKSSKSKQAPLIYKKLKEFSAAATPSNHDMGTPETKCESISQESPIFSNPIQNFQKQTQQTVPNSPLPFTHAVNLSSSFYSSRSNSPQMFSTSQPLLFERIVQYPDYADSVMDEEISPSPMSNKSLQKQASAFLSIPQQASFISRSSSNSRLLKIKNDGSNQQQNTIFPSQSQIYFSQQQYQQLQQQTYPHSFQPNGISTSIPIPQNKGDEPAQSYSYRLANEGSNNIFYHHQPPTQQINFSTQPGISQYRKSIHSMSPEIPLEHQIKYQQQGINHHMNVVKNQVNPMKSLLMNTSSATQGIIPVGHSRVLMTNKIPANTAGNIFSQQQQQRTSHLAPGIGNPYHQQQQQTQQIFIQNVAQQQQQQQQNILSQIGQYQTHQKIGKLTSLPQFQSPLKINQGNSIHRRIIS